MVRNKIRCFSQTVQPAGSKKDDFCIINTLEVLIHRRNFQVEIFRDGMLIGIIKAVTFIFKTD
jgi:hypothetical protein